MTHNATPGATVLLLLFLLVQMTQAAHQLPLLPTVVPLEWKIQISRNWDVLGPFPIHAREQHYLSPAFPLNLSEPIDFQKTWPSSYADAGRVGWTTANMSEAGEIRTSFHDIRWEYLRSFEGWAALQHHAVLRTTMKLVCNDQATDGANPHVLPNLLVHLKQGSYFTILPKDLSETLVPKWYAGNVYDLERTLPQVVELPPSTTREYHVFISGDYEIRLFGDPLVQGGSNVPTQTIKLELGVDVKDVTYVYEPSQNVLCDFVDGYAFGDAIGIGIRSVSGWLTVTHATLKSPEPGFEVSLMHETRIAPSQTRTIPLVLHQTAPLQSDRLEIVLTLKAIDQDEETLNIALPLNHLAQWSAGTRKPIRGSFFFGKSTPSPFICLPPLNAGSGGSQPPILALHGAGVDILGQSFWADSMPENNRSWIVMPTGRTSWGLDWHGPSAQDAWDSVSALSKILQGRPQWSVQAPPIESRVLLIGHSNGGQGTWYIASRFPDRVIAAVPAAAYIKAQSYIPLTLSRSAHFIDPILRVILETSLTPDDNDLHLSNLASTPVLAIHGGSDGNVPSWHSRELVNVLATWSSESIVSLKEDAGQGHWYSSVLKNADVKQFLDANSGTKIGKFPDSFTFTVSNPPESGPLHEFKIHSLVRPGRLGRLHVYRKGQDALHVHPSNIDSFSISTSLAVADIKFLVVSNAVFSISDNTIFPLVVKRETDGGSWVTLHSISDLPRVPTRLQTILTSSTSLTIVYSYNEELSLATRLAHDLQAYHRLDCEIVTEEEAIYRHSSDSWDSGNIVVLGTPRSKYVNQVLKERNTSFHVEEGNIFFQDRLLQHRERGFIFSHPHPNGKLGCMLFMLHSDEKSLERVGKLFPIRTGVAAPNWLVLGPSMDQLGAAGLEGAGVWDSDWKDKEGSSWFS